MGNITTYRTLSDRGVTMSNSSKNGRELLSSDVIKALMANDVDQLKQLRNAGEDFSLFDENGNSLLHLAIVDYNEREKRDKLFSSGHFNRAEAFDYILTLEEIQKDSCNNEGYTPLQEVYMYLQDSPGWAIELINSGCSVQNDGVLLQSAVYDDWPEVVELLIEKGVDIDFCNRNSDSSLYWACKLGLVDIIWMLLFYGANPCQFGHDGTCFDLAIKGSVRSEVQEIFLETSRYNFQRCFSLGTFIEAMESVPDMLYKLCEIIGDINWLDHDLHGFINHFGRLEPRLFKIFVQKYSSDVLEILKWCRLCDMVGHHFDCDEHQLNIIPENIMTIVESDIGQEFIEEFSIFRGDCDTACIAFTYGFYKNENAFAKLLFHLLSYGFELTDGLVDVIYDVFGHCSLFKLLLRMNVGPVSNRYIIPQIYWDLDMTPKRIIEHVTTDLRYGKKIHLLFDYFASPKLVECCRDGYKKYKEDWVRGDRYMYWKKSYELIPERLERLPVVPKLQEFARDAARAFIISRYKIKNCQHFYTIVNWLPIAKIHKEILGYERKLYE